MTRSLDLKMVNYTMKMICASKRTAKKNENTTLTQSEALRKSLNLSIYIEMETQIRISKNVPLMNSSVLSLYSLQLHLFPIVLLLILLFTGNKHKTIRPYNIWTKAKIMILPIPSTKLIEP